MDYSQINIAQLNTSKLGNISRKMRLILVSLLV